MSKSVFSVEPEWLVGAIRVKALCSDKFSENYIAFPIVQKLGLTFKPWPGSTTIQIAPGKCLQYLGYLYLYFNLASNRNITGFTKFFVIEGDLLPHGAWLGTDGTGEIPKRESPEAHPVEEDPQSKEQRNALAARREEFERNLQDAQRRAGAPSHYNSNSEETKLPATATAKQRHSKKSTK